MRWNTVVQRSLSLVLAFAMLPISLGMVRSSPAKGAPFRSRNVALVPNAYGWASGAGMMPTSGGQLDQFNFSDLALEDISVNSLAQFDTVVLLQCSEIATSLDSSQKQAINGWIASGGKLIIYDSDACVPPPDYSWLVYPFLTDNPGQLGSRDGSLYVVEDNTLSSANPTSPYYVDTAYLTSSTDAVGDANVMVTKDPHWFGNMTATNADHVTGWTHAYATYGSGLLIYDGLDTDDIATSKELQDIWLFELLQPWSPDALPHSTSVTASRAELITQINRTRDAVLRAYDTQLAALAQVEFLCAYRRTDLGWNLTEWLSFLWEAVSDSVTWVVELIDFFDWLGSPKDAFVPEGPPNGASDFDKLLNGFTETWEAVEDHPAKRAFDVVAGVSAFSGDWETLNSYSLFLEANSDLEKKADAEVKSHGTNVAAALNDIEDATGDADFIVMERTGPLKANGYAKVEGRAGMPWIVRLRIQRSFERLAASIPDPLPQSFPTGEVIAELERVRMEVQRGSVQNGIVRFPAAPTDATSVESRRAAIGRTTAEKAIADQLWDGAVEGMTARQVQTWENSFDFCVSSTKLVTMGKAGTAARRVGAVAGILQTGKDFGELVVGPNNEIPMYEGIPCSEALMMKEVETRLAFQEDLAALWQIAAGCDQYVRFEAGMPPRRP
jgi:hypothetical protein